MRHVPHYRLWHQLIAIPCGRYPIWFQIPGSSFCSSLTMAGRYTTLRTSSPRPWVISRLSQCQSLSRLMPTKGYSDRHGSTEIEAERASSTAEEFERIAEEKLKEAEPEISSQTAGEDHREGDGDPGSGEKRRRMHEEESGNKG
ncbi:hypothetical protein MLD38_022082 [Melastoma candidum]|uniref:Uncharacterized protein n=1 Tax=Melastoma candidum TaxID=119954 RepID=A0ACB9QM00_9MYRT|nr:hypothetical protein MLD38_022082 [Melastoma candidum]